jgi:hypothetical protein
MSDLRRTHRSQPDWQDTRPSPQPAAPQPAPRVQPPLTEAMQGLDTRELEGQTVFDQLFGDRPKARR